MKDYLAIIRKLDFIDLFKYGRFNINYATKFNGNINSLNNGDLFKKLTYGMNVYEYSFEYLIIHFQAEKKRIKAKKKLSRKAKKRKVQPIISIDVKNVRNVYTFNQEAKNEMEISFDCRIKLQVSPWADKFEKLQQQFCIEQNYRGVDNLWKILGLNHLVLNKCKKVVSKDIIQEVFRGLYSNERPSGEQSIWVYLLRYERHSFYPKGIPGFFCDFVHICCNYIKKQELSESIESTQIYGSLIKNENAGFDELLNIVKASPLYGEIPKDLGCDFAVVAPLFLFMKAEFAKEHKLSEELKLYNKKEWEFDFAVAVFLLGLVLGYDKTYDAFYDNIKLPLFNIEAISHNNKSILNNGGKNLNLFAEFQSESRLSKKK